MGLLAFLAQAVGLGRASEANGKYQSFATDENIKHKSTQWRSPWSRRRPFLLTLSALLALGLVLVFTRTSDVPVYHRDLELDRSRIHVLVPANNPDYQLCKLMVASSVLGYPTPHLINWGEAFKAPKKDELASGTHLAKISGVIHWLWKLEEHQMDDLVLVLDAYDLTLQLPIDLLIKRYYQVNRENDLRMSERPGMKRAMKEKGLYQSVVFSADKRCSPQLATQPWCYLQPESPLPTDLYGNRTDHEETPFSTYWAAFMRPRWLNSGMVIGPASDVLAIFLRAYQQMDKEINGSDQSLFNFVFSEQEYMREFWRQQSVNWVDTTPGKLADWVNKRQPGDAMHHLDHFKRQSEHKNPKWKYMSHAEQVADVLNPFSSDHKMMDVVFDLPKTEYHMGIDYYARLSKPTAGSETDVRQLTFNTQPPTGNLTRDWMDCNTGTPEFSRDLIDIPGPFPNDLVVPNGTPAPAKTWRDVPLFTDACTGVIPASIHHNGNKMKREYNWPEMWYHRYLIPLLELRAKQRAAAEDEAAASGQIMRDVNDGRMMNGDKSVTYLDVCPAWKDMLFKGCMWGHGWDCKPGEIPA